MYLNTPGGYYYHINVYSNGSVHTGFDYAAHGAAYALRQYGEPVGVIIDNGGHFVLLTFVTSDQDPLTNFWTNITFLRYRDPFRSPGGPPYVGNRVDQTYSQWQSTFSEYGWTGHTYQSAPNCGSNGQNCRDEARKGPYANNLWWGRWVTIERDGTSQNADLVWQLND